MHDSLDQQMRQLTAHYGQMWDDELLSLAADYTDLTDMARQVLRDEMRKRNLGDPSSPAPRPSQPQPAHFEARPTPPSRPPASTLNPKEPVRPVGAREEREWQGCKEHYAGLSAEDLEDIAAEYDCLTPIAQQVLREEMTRRGMADPDLDTGETDTFFSEETEEEERPNPFLAAAELKTQKAPAPNEWWVRVYETDDREKAEQYAIILSDAGIEHRWRVDPAGYHFIEVAAAQADDAHRVLAQPVPQSVIEDSKIEAPEFMMPRCPRCKNDEPVLLSRDPSNTWLCESCGNRWNDPVAEPNHI